MISTLNLENLKLKKHSENFEKLKSFNCQKEQILSIIEHNEKTFVITLQQDILYNGKLDDFYIRGYVIDNCEKDFINSSSIIKMSCEPKYNLNLGYLESIFIVDFQADHFYINEGYGSLIMNELIRYAQSLDVYYISGELSSMDIGKNDTDLQKKENRERLYHFYPKFGFEIYESSNGEDLIRKRIKKILKSRE